MNMFDEDDKSFFVALYFSFVTLCLFTPLTLTGGKGYLVVVGSYGDAGATNDLVVRTAGVSAP